MNILYAENLVGGKVVAKSNRAEWATNLTQWDNSSARISNFAQPGDYAYLTGYFVIITDNEHAMLTTSGVWIILNYNNPQWEADGRVRTRTYSVSEAQALVNRIIKANIKITQNNLLCARYASKFTAAQQQQIRELQQRVVSRDNELKNAGFCTDVKTSHPAGYAELEPYLAALMNGQAIGIATWAVVVIACAIIASLSTAAYFAYKYYASEAEKDVKFSEDLTKVLVSKLTPEEYEQLLNETKGIVTKARILQSIGSYGKIFIYAAAIVGGALLFRVIKNKG